MATRPVPLRAPSVAERADAADRITRLFARFVGLGYLLYLPLLVPAIRTAATLTDPWWTPLALITTFTPAIGMVAASFLPRLDLTRRAAVLAAIGYLIAVASWLPAWHGGHPAGGAALWLQTIPGLPAMAVTIAWSPLPTFGMLVVAVVGVNLANHLYWATPPPLLPELLFALAFVGIYVCASLMGLRTAVTLDRTRQAVRTAAAATSAREAQNVERTRFDALTHDWVMTTLLAASRNHTDPSVADLAVQSIAQLERMRGQDLPITDFDPEAVATHLRVAVATVEPELSVDVSMSPRLDDQHYPAESVRAMGAAVTEAVRNSVRHAGATATRSVLVTLEPDSASVQVSDDGVGFDPATVGPDRLGLAVGIRGRMSPIPGGHAAVDSAPDRGTTVVVGWRQP